MRHDIPADRLRRQLPAIDAMAGAVSSCVHCGFCLATCPTYLTLGEEMDSPRGRIVLMKEVLEGGLELEEALPHLDPCLGCVACETSCPSGVAYGSLITPFRWWSEAERSRGSLRSRLRRARRHLLLRTLTAPRLRAPALRLGAWARPLRRFLPKALAAPLDLLPERLPRRATARSAPRVRGEPRARVAVLRGCVQESLRPQIHRSTLAVLARHGVEVIELPGVDCCGALAMHSGEAELARRQARTVLEAAARLEVDALVSHAAGCGSGMKEYPLLFRGEPEEEGARALARRLRDAGAFLAELGPTAPLRLARPLRVVYHDPCHLAHAQRERQGARRLLGAIENLELVEAGDWEVCCGSAGIYNLEQPEIAGRLGERRARALRATGADVVVTANIGCQTQLARHLEALGAGRPVLHLFELLERAGREGEEAAGSS